MKLSIFLHPKPGINWQLAKQIGVNHAIAKLSPENTGQLPPWDRDSLARSLMTYNDFGFEVTGLEGDQFDMSRIKRGLPGRDEDIENYIKMLQNMGELGIPLLCYNFMVHIGWYRTQPGIEGRGGALVSGFSLKDVDNETPTEIGPLPVEEVFENYRYFIQKVLPTAEKAGVTMEGHPDDPPIPELHKIGRILSSVDGFRRALSISNSPSHKITFCQANFKLMGDDLLSPIHEFGSRGKIAFVHWRDVHGTAENFRETFHDNGPTNMAATLKAYHKIGFKGPIRLDHVPAMAGEDVESSGQHAGYGMLGRLFAMGYLKGMLEALDIPYL